MIAKLAFCAVLLVGICSCRPTVPTPSTAKIPASTEASPKSSQPFFIAFPDETNAPAVAIYVVRWSVKYPEPQLISALWPDGRIIWSRSSLKGGPPYWKGRYVSAKLDALVDDWDRQGVFKQSEFFAVPDAALTNIEINHRGREVSLVSSHELLPPDSIPESRRGFYDVWSKIRKDLQTLVPESGESYEGTILHNR